MNANLTFWLSAFALFSTSVGFAWRGIAQARSGDMTAHRRSMNVAILLIGLFLVGYLLKVGWLGREDRSQWSRLDLTVLRAHESFIAIMLVCGAWARLLARRLQQSQVRTTIQARHRRLGRAAAIAAALALITATHVLVRMASRPGNPTVELATAHPTNESQPAPATTPEALSRGE